MAVYLNGHKITGEIVKDGVLMDKVYFDNVLVHQDVLQPKAGKLLRIKGTGKAFVRFANDTASGTSPTITVSGTTTPMQIGVDEAYWDGDLSDNPVEFVIDANDPSVNISFLDNNAYRGTLHAACDLNDMHYLATSFMTNQVNLETFFAINTNAQQDSYALFNNCIKLKDVALDDFSNMYNLELMFANTAIDRIPAVDLPAAISMNGTFMGCKSIVSCADLTIPLCTTMNSTFKDCSELTNIGNILTSGALEHCTSIFHSCEKLICIKAIHTDQNTDTTDMFDNTPVLFSPSRAFTAAADPYPHWQSFIESGYPWQDIDCNNDPDTIYSVPPPVSNWSASLLQTNKITILFAPVNSIPAAQYDLYEGNTRLATNISSGYVYSTTRASVTLRIRSYNFLGENFSSPQTGTTKAGSGSVTYNTPGTHTFYVPRGYTSLRVCISAGGGSGVSFYNGNLPSNANGGRAGASFKGTVNNFVPGSLVTVNLGSGGSSSNEGSSANNGQPSSLSATGVSTISLSGGAGGAFPKTTGGVTGCDSATKAHGTFYESDYHDPQGSCGGEASIFNRGGAGTRYGSDHYKPGSGHYGSGGGGAGRESSTRPAHKSGAGGFGMCVVSWS